MSPRPRRIDPDMPVCKECGHYQDQHEPEGYCEVENGVLGFCRCAGFIEKEKEIPEL